MCMRKMKKKIHAKYILGNEETLLTSLKNDARCHVDVLMASLACVLLNIITATSEHGARLGMGGTGRITNKKFVRRVCLCAWLVHVHYFLWNVCNLFLWRASKNTAMCRNKSKVASWW